MRTSLFITIVLLSGATAGLIHGGTNLVFVEPSLDQAIGIENEVTGPGSPTATWKNVPYCSDYKIVENTVPPGYIKMPDIINISITTQGQTVNITVDADVDRTA